MFELDGSRGLGDALYVRAVALYLLERGEKLAIFTQWPDVFTDLAVTVRPLTAYTGREDLHHVVSCLHCRVCPVKVMDKFTLSCRQAGIEDDVPLRVDWRPRNPALVERIRRKAGGRPVLLYQPPKIAGSDEQREQEPSREAFCRVIDHYAGTHYRVKTGHGKYVHGYGACEMDLFGKLTVTDALDLCTVADLSFSTPSFLGIMAEAQDKPHLCMFTRRAAVSPYVRARNLTPARFFHKPELGTAIYDE